MSLLLGAVAGFAGGALTGWLLGRRRGRRAPAADLLSDEFLGSDTASYLAAALPAESSFESLAYALVERGEERTGMPCALAMRERDGGPVSLQSVSSGLDPRLKGTEVDVDSGAGRAITDGIPVVGEAGTTTGANLRTSSERLSTTSWAGPGGWPNAMRAPA